MKKRLLVLIAVAAALFILPCALPYAANAADDGPEPSGKIPVLTITIGGQDAEYIDDETGETVTEKLTADEVIEKMNSSDDHSFRATNGKVSLTITEGLKKYSSPDGTYCIPSEGLALEFMRGRGNSTWLPGEDNKKPYKFKLQKRAKLVGDNSSKHWVLMANALDPTKLKNKFTSWLGCSLGMEFTPECIPVDVVLKGETYNKYLGCYYLSEEVRVDKSSVDVPSWCEDQE